MAETIKLANAEKSGVYVLPDGLTFDTVRVILVNGEPVAEGRYVIVANNTAVDIFDTREDTVVSVVLK